MTWRERLERFTRAERLAKLEARMDAVDAKLVVVEQRVSRILWQARRIVSSVVKQFTGRVDDGDDG